MRGDSTDPSTVLPCNTLSVAAESRKEAIAKVKAVFSPPRYDRFMASPAHGQQPSHFFRLGARGEPDGQPTDVLIVGDDRPPISQNNIHDF